MEPSLTFIFDSSLGICEFPQQLIWFKPSVFDGKALKKYDFKDLGVFKISNPF